jgi:transposase InsO family protein
MALQSFFLVTAVLVLVFFFSAKFFVEVCRELGIAKVFTTAHIPQTKGQVERFHRTILYALRTYAANSQTDWDEYTAAFKFV